MPSNASGKREGKAMRIVTKDVNNGAPQAAVVIPVADADDEITRRCVDNLGKTVRVPIRVLLVESSGGEFAYGRSANAGIRAAEGFEFVIGMDSDAFPRAGAIERLLEFMRMHPQVGYSGAAIVGHGSRPDIGWVHQNMFWFAVNALKARAPLFALKRLLRGGWWTFGVRAPGDYVPGRMVGAVTTTFALRRRCYDDVGPFDERYRVSFVDVDYCFRVLISDKWYVSSCPDAEVVHEVHATRRARRDIVGLEGWDRFLDSWPKERMKLVKEAARRGKFLVPDHGVAKACGTAE